MKIPNKREFQQIGFNRSSDIDFQDFMNLYKKCNSKPYSFLIIDTTIVSDNSSRFNKNLSERMEKLIMTIDDERCKLKLKKYNTILIEKQQKYQHYHHVKLINMNIFQAKKKLPSYESRMIEQA